MQLIPLVHSQERNLQEMQTEFVETLAVNYADQQLMKLIYTGSESIRATWPGIPRGCKQNLQRTNSMVMNEIPEPVALEQAWQQLQRVPSYVERIKRDETSGNDIYYKCKSCGIWTNSTPCSGCGN